MKQIDVLVKCARDDRRVLGYVLESTLELIAAEVGISTASRGEFGDEWVNDVIDYLDANYSGWRGEDVAIAA